MSVVHLKLVGGDVEAHKETWYMWKCLRKMEDEEQPRLFTPWSDGMQYEYPMDLCFESPEEAKGYLKEQEIEKEEDWQLVRVDLEIVG